ncbi:MAG: protein kinase, partial [Planctomycetaceae bacterium]
MIEPPSKKLQQQLEALHLCGRGDLRSCRGRVRRLARDLPAFDSVWIDALLQNRNITPFQARLLDSPHAERLAVGPCVLVDRLGRGPHSTTYIARPRNGDERCVLKVVREIVCPAAAALEQLQSLVERSKTVRNVHVVVPNRVVLHEDRPVLLSRFAAGQPLTGLLIRRGRFPASIVAEIGRQLVDGSAALESAGLIHGDVTLWNARLLPSGDIVLVDAGVMPIVQSDVAVRADVGPERYDGIAPERIATGDRATASSDMYALGCLLWQLAAGRPPFPTGDPLAKLAQHQTREVADVREWAPDTPEPLARSIAAMTAFDAADRPESFAVLAGKWGASRPAGRRRLKS